MQVNISLLAAVLTVVSVVSLSLVSLLCLRCKSKKKIIQEKNPVYDPQTFQRGGSKFVLMGSKTVTRTNQLSSTAAETLEVSSFREVHIDGQSDYINITEFHTGSSSPEHDYVAPIAAAVYENEMRTPDADQTPGIYGNVFPSMSIADDDDYENSDFLEQKAALTEEPDYVNENGE
ncbi:uncharacterized protein PAE49_018291 [Odontesthes bonariensis]|uniref:uncharacterized protein LOC142401449 n=1 Tax=Odontesthes bonariensis TaxID=219752 RepID=UPI003F58BC10